MGGAPRNPDWYYNLKAHPEVTIETGTGTGTGMRRGRAGEVTGEERDRLYGEMAARYPNFAGYQRATDRRIPVFAVTLES